jgi:precorrin-6B methylase 2
MTRMGWLSRRWLVVELIVALTMGSAWVFAARPAQAQAPGQAQAQSPYSRLPPSADGIGKAYMGREIAAVMGWQGAAWLEREEREREERTDLLIPALALRPGDVVADIGAGTGYLSRRLATAVGPRGRVLAVDVQPEMVRLLQALVRREGLRTVQAVLGTETDVKLPAGSVDLAIMVDVYHELAFPQEMMGSVLRALKPGGRVVFVEYRAEDDRVPIKSVHKMSLDQVRREAAAAGLSWERTFDGLPWQHVVVFRNR